MSDDRLFPHAAPGSQGGATRAGALAVAAATLAASAFAIHSATSAGRPPQAPHCGLTVAKPGDWSASDDLDGCWERRGDRQYFRTTWGGRYYYHWEPPSSSRYHDFSGVGG